LPIPDIAKRRDQRLIYLFGRWRLWAPLILILFAALVSILSSPSFSKCMVSHSAGEGFRDGAILKFRCIGSFVVDYAPAISAVAEGGIALIIFIMWVYIADVLKNAAAQSDLIRHSVELTRVALVSSAPPALTFRGFSLVERSFGEKQRVQVHFTVTNRGGTTATITDTGAAVVLVQSMLPADVNFAKRAITNVTLRSGEATS
jgi:hypothetical protein